MRAECKLEEKAPMSAVGNPFIIFFFFNLFLYFKIPGRNHLPVKSES